MVLKKLKKLIRGADAATEDESKRDGFLSYSAEWHAFTHGVYLGFTTRPQRTPEQPDNEDVQKEPHYYRGGYIIGSGLQLLVIGGTALAAGSGAAGIF